LGKKKDEKKKSETIFFGWSDPTPTNARIQWNSLAIPLIG
jgi:hypothetical protein